MFDDSRRSDDRDGLVDNAGAQASGTNERNYDRPPVLRRRTVSAFAILGIFLILYGTTVPFQIDPDRSLRWDLGWEPPAPGDTVSNLLIYVPVGVLLRLLVRRRGSSRLREYGWSLLIAGSLSYLTEMIQTVLTARVPSWTDAVLNFTGALIGIALAPTFQRVMRNMHAYLYGKLRREPFSAAAAAVMLCVCTYALAPPDFHPGPGHVAASIQRLRAAPSAWLWGTGEDVGDALTSGQAMDKVIAAGSYALLAFVLLLSARETGGRPLAMSAWYAFSRSALLATVIEAMQLFTISHTADFGDLVAAWLAGLAGAGVAWFLVRCRGEIHRQPGRVLRGMVAATTLALLGWAIGIIALSPRSGSPITIYWLPLFHDFHRSWNGLLGDYTAGLLQYGVVAGLLVLWCRSLHRRPGRCLVLCGVLATAVLVGASAVFRHNSFDTAQLLLAVLAGVVALRMDRAIFDKRPLPATAPQTHPPVWPQAASEPSFGRPGAPSVDPLAESGPGL